MFKWLEGRRESSEYLKACVSLPLGDKRATEAEVIMAMWGELAPDLAEPDE